ncbi:hypothetical protein CGLO_06236 [Colletotrichum gloeosporioides Cg-14]|uniref:Uncharacterized protein n=1 Tax=Colletotrichum gloeosporioides (strain Cg-14) TaxID=1237896 RepID=T0LZL0_COLGC|nr:hypothetical protein CGLO_06236 [Colletotrichum gloeosporioides Cg-14]
MSTLQFTEAPLWLEYAAESWVDRMILHGIEENKVA